MTDTWRVSNHQPQNLYRDGKYVGVMFAPGDAAWVVALANSEPLPDAMPSEVERLRTQLAIAQSQLNGRTAGDLHYRKTVRAIQCEAAAKALRDFADDLAGTALTILGADIRARADAIERGEVDT